MAGINVTFEPGSLRSGVHGEWSDTTRSISPCIQIADYTECRALFPIVQIRPPPHPLTLKGVLLLPPLGPRGETHSLAEEGVGELNSDEGTDTLVLYVYYNPSTTQIYQW
jgi:hypothetical protein